MALKRCVHKIDETTILFLKKHIRPSDHSDSLSLPLILLF